MERSKLEAAWDLAIEILKYAGAVVLLCILVKGIYSIDKTIFGRHDSIAVNSDGNSTNSDFGLACIVGVALWFYILIKIKKSGMSDEEKREYERKERDGE